MQWYDLIFWDPIFTFYPSKINISTENTRSKISNATKYRPLSSPRRFSSQRGRFAWLNLTVRSDCSFPLSVPRTSRLSGADLDFRLLFVPSRLFLRPTQHAFNFSLASIKPSAEQLTIVDSRRPLAVVHSRMDEFRGVQDAGPPAPSSFPCTECQLTFTTKDELMDHNLAKMKSEEGHLRCAFCNKDFHVIDGALSHIREV